MNVRRRREQEEGLMVTDTGCPCLVLSFANLRSKQGANWTFVPFFEMWLVKWENDWIERTLRVTSTVITPFFLHFVFLFFFTSAKKSGFAGVLCGVCGGTIARKEVGATLLHGLAKGSAGPQSGPVALRVFHFIRIVNKVRHQGAAHPFPICILQSESSCTVSQSFPTIFYNIQFYYTYRDTREREKECISDFKYN